MNSSQTSKAGYPKQGISLCLKTVAEAQPGLFPSKAADTAEQLKIDKTDSKVQLRLVFKAKRSSSQEMCSYDHVAAIR